MGSTEAENGTQRITFDRYVLDLKRGCLLADGREVELRPKTFGVLRFLATNPGRLVSKEELLAAVWPNLVVTDDTLVQSVGELRRALGEDGARFIKTLPRRGYRFDAGLEAIAVPTPTPTPTPTAPSDNLRPRLPPITMPAITAGLMIVALALWLAFAQRGQAPLAPSVAHPLSGQPVIAVLPFANHDPDEERDYFADGLTQDIINALGRFSAVTVMSWNAVLPWKGKPVAPGELTRQLGTRYHVEGSVRFSDRLHVLAQLVDADGRVLWSSRYDEALPDIVALQDRITREIAGALAIRVSDVEQLRLRSKPPSSFEAYDYVLRARPALRRPTRANIAEARSLLRRAIDLDPNYAAAHAALAETFHIAISMGWAESPEEYWNRAEELANRALQLDESDVRAHAIIGRIHIAYNRYEQAGAAIDRAVAINPSDADGLAARGNILVWLGKTDEAIESLELAQRIDPELNAFDGFALSMAYYLKRRYDAAIEQAELNLRRNEAAHFNQGLLAASYAQAGRTQDAARVAQHLRRTDPTFDAASFGNKFSNQADLAHVREGLAKAGLYSPGGG